MSPNAGNYHNKRAFEQKKEIRKDKQMDNNIPNHPPNSGNSVFVRVPFGKTTYPFVTPGVTWTLDHSDKRLAGAGHT